MRILLVDDDPLIRSTIGRLLSRHAIVRTAEAEDAIGWFETERFDALVTDVDMGEYNGCDLAAEIDRRWPGTRVVLITGSSPPPKVRWPVVTKPFVTARLLSALDLRPSLPPAG